MRFMSIVEKAVFRLGNPDDQIDKGSVCLGIWMGQAVVR